MTNDQSALLGSLGDYGQQVQGNYDQATDYYKGVLGGGYDPRNSDYYKGLRQEAGQLKADSNTAIRRQAAAGGMLQSSPTQAQIGDNERQVNNTLLTQLGGMYENERSRMGQAAQGLQQADSQRLQATGQVASLMDMERQIEQQKMDALYNQALQTVMFPYQYQAGLANSIFSGSQGSQPIVTGGGLTDLGFIASVGGSVAGSYFGAKAEAK